MELRIGPGESEEIEQRKGNGTNESHVLETRQASDAVSPCSVRTAG